MRIGVPKEIKTGEGRVALVPAAVADLVHAGHTLFVQAGAGIASGYSDDEYRAAGAAIAADAAEIYRQAQLLLKVKEPQPPEFALLRSDQLLFSFLHLSADKRLTEALLRSGATAVAFEHVEEHGRFPLLAPMSEIAGRLAVQIGATLLHGYRGGRGVLLGEAKAGDPGRVVILGAGVAGEAAAAAAAAIGARVTVFARRVEQRDRVSALGTTALTPDPMSIERAVIDADLVVGALRVPSGLVPKLVTASMVKKMKRGAVIVDICVDQGGCIETTRPTTYAEPTFVHEGVIHFAVPNMPGAVPRTASQMLSAALLPYVLRLARASANGIEQDPALARAVNVADGRIVHPEVAKVFDSL